MTLDETYERILLGIDREKREHAIRLLQCLAFSRRPLRAKELAEVLAVQFDTAIPKLNTSLRPGDAHEAVLSACSTLVTIIKHNGYSCSFPYSNYYENSNPPIVQFSHYSVKEFLTSERLARSDRGDLSHYYISPEPAHTILAQSCISTLLQPDIHIERITDSFPLANYAARNWFHHARCDGVASRIQDGMERLFDPDRNHFSVWISTHDIENPWSSSITTEASPLYYAALCGIGSLVEHLLIKRRLDPNGSHGGQGRVPLHAAAFSGHATIVRHLLEHAADVNARHIDNMTPLYTAITEGNLEVAQLLLSHGADASALDHRGDAVLLKAVRSQKLDRVELLLKGGADVNIRNAHNTTALHEATESGNLDIVRLLLNHGADVNLLDNQGNSPLYKAVRSQKLDRVELLLKGGADVNSRNTYNETPLHEATNSGNLNIVRLLISHVADVNLLDYLGYSPLHNAARLPIPDIVELLLNNGADVNARNTYKATPLHEATERGNLDIVRLLLGHGAGVNARGGFHHKTPLHLTSLVGSLDMSRLLIEHGADIGAQDYNGRTPFSIALAYGHRKLARLLSNDRIPEHEA